MEISKINLPKAILGGVLGTIAMTFVGAWLAPMMGMPPMNPAELLAKVAGDNIVVGWIGHFLTGIVLAIIYAAFQSYLPGPSFVRGALYSIAPWLAAMLIVMPLIGMPLFMGAGILAVRSLVGHLVFGAVLGATYGNG